MDCGKWTVRIIIELYASSFTSPSDTKCCHRCFHNFFAKRARLDRDKRSVFNPPPLKRFKDQSEALHHKTKEITPPWALRVETHERASPESSLQVETRIQVNITIVICKHRNVIYIASFNQVHIDSSIVDHPANLNQTQLPFLHGRPPSTSPLPSVYSDSP